MKLSIVTTLYNSQACVEEFHRRMTAAILQITDDYEIIMVNDSSHDNTLSIARTLVQKDHHVKVIDLARNFGEHKARMTGLKSATGDYIFLIGGDLEVNPETLSLFHAKLSSDRSVDLVMGVQETRREKGFDKLTNDLFYKIVN